jgi:hypothetical protein
MAGAIYIIATNRVYRLNLPVIKVMPVAALDAKNGTSTEAAKQAA